MIMDIIELWKKLDNVPEYLGRGNGRLNNEMERLCIEYDLDRTPGELNEDDIKHLTEEQHNELLTKLEKLWIN